MRKIAAASIAFALFTAGLFSSEVMAQELSEKVLRKALKKFDENGNGTLDPAELEKAKAAWLQMQARRGADAQRAATDEPAAPIVKPKPTEAELLATYDINGNGRLDPEERLIAEQDFEKQQAPDDKKPAVTGDPPAAGAPMGEESLEDFEKRLLAKYDENGNNSLDGAERTAAAGEIAKWRVQQRLIQKRKADAVRGMTPDQKRLLAMFDDNKDYTLDQNERDFAIDQFNRLRKGGWDAVVELHSRLLEQFDVNKSGEIDGREKAVAVQFVIRIATQLEAARKREAAANKLRNKGLSKKEAKLRQKLDQ